MRVNEISKNDSPYLEYAFKLVKHWDDIVDYYFEHEYNLSQKWLSDKEDEIFAELDKVGYEFYIGSQGKGVIDTSKNLLYRIDTNPYKPIHGIRSEF